MPDPPIFVFDSEERWFPVGVEESLDAVRAVVPRSFPGANNAHGVRDGVYIDFPPDMRQPDLPPVVYHRTVGGGPLVWEQYWLWYLYNPKRYVGYGEHEGDWEFVQLGYTRDGLAVLATASQHHTGSKREFWATEVRGGRPVFYVARDSHANYFAPGRTLEDIADGEGQTLRDYELRPFGPWATWAGRWGNSRGEGKSPESPGCQEARWHAPHLYHSSSH
jgi:hypothetical protein